MAATKRKAPNKKIVKKVKKPNYRLLRLEAPLKKLGIVFAILLFASVGSYLLIFSGAEPNENAHKDNPARGMSYKGLTIAADGPCKGLVEEGDDGRGNKLCGHPDAGPVGIDVRERVKHIDEELANQVEADAQKPPIESDDTSQDAQVNTEENGAADVGSAGSLGSVSPRVVPCTGDGSNGARVQAVYLYVSGATNRISTLKSSFYSISQRMNAVTYNSGVEGGVAKQIRFRTTVPTSDGKCSLHIPQYAISSSSVNSFSSIKSFLASKGHNAGNRKYMVWVDGGSGCGYGTNWVDTSKAKTNTNNTTAAYAVVWKPCWNYAEPHEFMHTLGTVAANAPHHTKFSHCYDQHDIMCYNDGSGIAMKQICTNSVYIWRYDCRDDDYFDSTPAAGTYLSNYWNPATTSVFLYSNPQ